MPPPVRIGAPAAAEGTGRDAIALSAGPDTDVVMPHALDTHLRAKHQVAAIAGRMPTPESVAHARDAATVVIPLRRQGRPTRDGVRRPSAVAPLDAQQRLFVTKVAAELAWTPSTPLVLTITGGSVVVRPGTQTGPALTPVRLDGQGRLRLPTRVLAVLDLRPSEAVLAVGLPQLGELRLFAAADVAQLATGPLALPECDDDPSAAAVTKVPAPARATRVRAAFKAAAPA